MNSDTELDNLQSASRAALELLVNDAMDDIARLFSGITSVHQVDPAVAAAVMNRLDRINHRLILKLNGVPSQDEKKIGPRPSARVHPAVETFLARKRSSHPDRSLKCL